jgi:chorismate-pyruvate lyase
MASSSERSILLSPAPVARAAALAARLPEQRWMLSQPREVRRSYAAKVLDHPDPARRQEIWMLRQPRPVRESYISTVLERQNPLPRQQIWMLRQSDKVRESFVREVLLAAD